MNGMHRRVPMPTRRLAFDELTADDLTDMAALLSDPVVMRYYPHPKDRGEALAWIQWNQGLYQQEGYGLWRIRLRATGEFVGDCGLTRQEVGGATEIEVGYHVRADLQGRGYATEAATACRDHAFDWLHARRLIAIIHPDNTASQRVAEKIGLAHERDFTTRSGGRARLYAVVRQEQRPPVDAAPDSPQRARTKPTAPSNSPGPMPPSCAGPVEDAVSGAKQGRSTQ
jgi:RimJ/RimL family protein N-acetyltransferase